MVEAVVPARPRDSAVRTGLVMVVIAAVLFGVNGPLSKVVLEAGVPAQRLTELRSAGAFVGMLAILAIWAPQRLRVRRAELPVLALYGIVGFAFVQWFYFVSIQRLPVGVALLIEYTAPLLVALWARFGDKEHVRPQVWWALALALSGLIAVAQIWNGLTLDGVGVTAGFAAAFSLAFYFVLGERKVRGDRDAVSLVCLAFGFAALFWSVLQPWWTFPWARLRARTSLHGHLASTAAPVWLLCVMVIVGGTIIPFALMIGSLAHLPATQVGVAAMTEPIVATIIAWAWLGESLAPAQLIGGVVVLAGIVLAQTARPSDPVRHLATDSSPNV
jgi:drug/metabolite transporter (DMT)-like permease